MSMERHDQYDKDNRDNQDLTNIVNVLPIEILLMIIEKNIIGHIDNWDDIFKFNNVAKAITEEIANIPLICKAFNDMKLSISKMAYNLINKKFKILEDKARDEYVALSRYEIKSRLIKVRKELKKDKFYNIDGFDASVIYDIVKVLMFNSYCDIEDYLIIDAANVVFIWAVIHGNKSIIDLLLKSKVDLIKYNNLNCNKLPEKSVLSIAMTIYDENGTLPADYCALAMAACQEDESMADFLISKGSDVGQAFIFSAGAGYINPMEYFISKKSHLISKDEIRDALLIAIDYRRIEAVKLILSLGIDVNDINGSLFEVVEDYKPSRKIAELLLDNGANINYKYTNDLKNALQVAIESRNYKSAQMFINRGIDINSRDINGDSPLISLIKFRSEPEVKEWRILYTREIVQSLFDKNIDVNTKDNNDKSALMWAAELTDIEIVNLLIRGGANVNAQDKSGFTALIYALKSGNKDTVKLLIANGADYVGVLFNTVKSDSIEAMDFLIDCGINVNIQYTNGCTALVYALKLGKIDMAKTLLANGARFCTDSLFYVVKNGHCDILKILLRLGASVNIYNLSGETTLICAVKNGHIEIAKLLIKNGVNIDAQDNNGCTALIYALGSNQMNMVGLLLANKADIANNLLFAAKNGCYRIANMIIKLGVNIDTHNLFGETALMVAVRSNHIDVVRLLLKNKSNINAKNIHGRNSLMLAVESQNVDMVKLLINNGININCKDKYGNSALTWAFQTGNNDIIKLIILKMPSTNKSNP